MDLNPEDIMKYPWTDIGAGILFADFYQYIFRYVLERKSWFDYADGTWHQDIGGPTAMKLCMELADLLHMYVLKTLDEHKRKSYMDYSKQWQSHGCRVNILKDAQVYHPISAINFDTDPYIFNCKNGTIHIKECTYTEHSSKDELAKILMSFLTLMPEVTDGIGSFQKPCPVIKKKQSFFKNSLDTDLPEIQGMNAW